MYGVFGCALAQKSRDGADDTQHDGVSTCWMDASAFDQDLGWCADDTFAALRRPGAGTHVPVAELLDALHRRECYDRQVRPQSRASTGGLGVPPRDPDGFMVQGGAMQRLDWRSDSPSFHETPGNVQGAKAMASGVV